MPNAKTDEGTLWKWMKKAKLFFKASLDLNRVENGVSSGMPDTEGCLRGVQFWIELKCSARPARPTTPIKPKFRPAQVPWLKRRWKAGGRAFVLLQVAKGADASRYLIHASKAKEMEEGRPESWYKLNCIAQPDARPEHIITAAAHAELAHF